jgi:PAS domain S-box-containing protein
MTPAHRLLVIDDNRELVDNLIEIFDVRGFAVRVAPSAAEGLGAARAEGFDLAMVDVNLPDSSGLELLPALREAVPLGEVVLITGHATIDSAIAAVRGGAFHYVVKPFKPEDLIATAERALRQVQLRRERAGLLAQLQDSERRYRDVVESSQVLVVGMDQGGHVRMVNRRVTEVTGYAAPELEGENFVRKLFPAESRAAAIEHLSAAAEGRFSGEFEATVLTRDARVRTVRWHAWPAHARAEHGGDELTVYAVGTDVTERLALERRAAEAEALAHMGTLAAGLAHEIRNPLNAAGLQLHLLGRSVERLAEGERAGLRPRVEIVASELKRLERLLSDFLELARPRPMAREPVDMHALLSEVVAFHEPTAQARGVSLVRRIADGVAVGDRERLKQVFHNLVVNAMEASSPGDVITVAAERDGGDAAHVVVAVSDTGRGIPVAAMERIFEPFFTTKEAGTGLGLSIVRQIAERHGGAVALESAEGRGTRVTVRIPAARQDVLARRRLEED